MITAWLAARVYMRWERSIREQYGWQLSRITNILTNATPRVFNYRIIWADGSKGPAELSVENYMAMGQMRSIPLWCELEV